MSAVCYRSKIAASASMVSLLYEGEKQVIKFMLKKKRALIFWFVSSMVSLFSLSSQNSAPAQLRHNPSKDHSQQSGEEQASQTRAMALCLEIACKPWWIGYRRGGKPSLLEIDQSRRAFTSRARSLRSPLLG